MRPDRNFQERQRKWDKAAYIIGGIGVAAMAGGLGMIIDSGVQHPLLNPLISSGTEFSLGLGTFAGGGVGVLGSAVMFFNRPTW